MCIASNHTAGATVVTVNFTGGSGTCNVAAEMSEWAGMGTVTVDQLSQNNATGSTQSTGSTPDTLNIEELAIAQDTAGNETTSPGSPTNGFTALTTVHSGSGTTGTTTTTAYLLTTTVNATPGTSWFDGGGNTYIAQVVTLSASTTCAGSFIINRNVGSGHLLMLTASTNGGFSPKAVLVTPTDNNGGSWTCKDYQCGGISSCPDTNICWAPNSAGGPTAVSVNYSGGTTQCDVKANLSEWTGPSGTVALDGHSAANFSSNSNPNTGTTSTTTANFELAMAMDECDVPGCIVTSGPTNGYTAMSQLQAAYSTDH